MEATCSSETSAKLCLTIWRYIPDDSAPLYILNYGQRRKINLKRYGSLFLDVDVLYELVVKLCLIDTNKN
jgi:hypothetical protein